MCCSILERVLSASLEKGTPFLSFVIEHIEELEKDHPGQLLVVESMAPNGFIDPHRGRLVEAIGQWERRRERSHGTISMNRGSGIPSSVNARILRPIATPLGICSWPSRFA